MQAFYNSLSDDGILVMQLGEAPQFDSPDETYSKYKNRAATTKLLEDLGFESIHTYEEVSRRSFIIARPQKHTDSFSLSVLHAVKTVDPLWIRCAMDLCDWLQVSQHSKALVRECRRNRSSCKEERYTNQVGCESLSFL